MFSGYAVRSVESLAPLSLLMGLTFRNNQANIWLFEWGAVVDTGTLGRKADFGL